MLEVLAIRKNVGRTDLLKDVTFTLRPSEVLGITGGNGAGKSTLIDILMGRTLPDSGKVSVDGKCVVSAHRSIRAPIFRTHQVPRLFFGLSIAANLRLGRWATSQKEEPLPTIHGFPSYDESARVLSIGQRRRVLLDWIKARLDTYRFLLLDEPTAGADPEYTEQLGNLILEAKALGVGVLLVEHKPDFLARLCDRHLVLHDGTLKDGAQAPSFADESYSIAGPVPEQPILEAENISVARGSAEVVINLSLTVSPGQTLVMTGPNGCGKSSVLLALYGLHEARTTAGRILYAGSDVTAMSHTERLARGIHLLPQQAVTFDSLTVCEMLQLTAGNHLRTVDDTAVQSIAHSLPLISSLLDRKCGVLSGGERRVVGLGRLLLAKPVLALLDEPLAGLSPENRKIVGRVIAKLAAQGSAVIIAEQEDLLSYLHFNSVHRFATPTPIES